MRILEKIKILFNLIFHRKQKEKRPIKTRVKKSDDFGCLYYFGDLLDTLDDYFKSIKHLRKYDPSRYRIYKSLGGQVVNSDSLFKHQKLERFWLEQTPTFGMVHLRDYGGENVPLSLAYYVKVERPYFVESSKFSEIYEVNTFFAKTKNKNALKYADKFHVAVGPGGEIKLLKEIVRYKVSVGGGMVNRKKFQYPSYILEWIAQLDKDSDIENPQEMAQFVFALIANSIVSANAGIQVSVKSGGANAVFNIDMLRTPYFFKDREKTVNKRGRTKKIFHIVRTHKRQTRRYGEVYVKAHFRGLQRFHWNGYEVNIKSPKRDYHLIDFDAPMVSVGEKEKRVGLISGDKVAEILKQRNA